MFHINTLPATLSFPRFLGLVCAVKNGFFAHLIRHAKYIALAFGLAATSTAWSANDDTTLYNLSLERLLDLKISNVSRETSRYLGSAAALYVLGQDDIRRSGAKILPDVLKLVPGLHVARIDGNKWSISARGFNGMFANKLLVLIDGRTVYTPWFAGVLWDEMDLALSDIEHIEIIRGPGASVWGANAVNGIINIVTRRAGHTPNGQTNLTFSKQEQSASLRYGGQLGEGQHYRLTAHHRERDGFYLEDGTRGKDDMRTKRLDWRFDQTNNDGDQIIVTAHAANTYSGTQSNPWLFGPGEFGTSDFTWENKAYHVMGRYSAFLGQGHEMNAQLYVTSNHRYSANVGVGLKINVYDFDTQFFHNLGKHRLIWGINYRVNKLDMANTYAVGTEFGKTSEDLFSLFMQSEFRVIPKKFSINIGSKFEKPKGENWIVQPSVRFTWRPNKQRTLWLAASRSARSPSWTDRLVYTRQVYNVPGLGNTEFNLQSNPEAQAEWLKSFELGWREQIGQGLLVDFSLYRNFYSDLMSIAIDDSALRQFSQQLLQQLANLPPGFDQSMVPIPALPAVQGSPINAGKASTYGSELSVDWQIRHDWGLRFTYSRFKEKFSSDTLIDPSIPSERMPGNYPGWMGSLLIYGNLTPNLSSQLNIRTNSGLPIMGIARYTVFDLNFLWNINRFTTLSLAARDLGQGKYYEYSDQFVFSATQIAPSYYAGLQFKW